MNQLRSWYDVAIARRGYTTVGASGLGTDELADFMCSLLRGLIPEASAQAAPMLRQVNLVADDIRAMYAEALTAQPGQERVDADTLADWFYRETAAGRALYTLRRMGGQSDDEAYASIARSLAFPARLAP